MDNPSEIVFGATKEIDCNYDMFIIADGKVAYRVHWWKIFASDGGSKYVVDPQQTGPTNTLGRDEWKKDKLLAGYQKRGEGGELSEPLEVESPIKKENR